MTEEQALNHKVDRTGWPKGPWDEEPDRIEWRHLGFACLMVRSDVGVWCGYLGVPPGHPWHGDPDPEGACAHGGVNYASACAGRVCHVAQPGEPADVWWLGFDCGHAFDLIPSISAHPGLRTAELAKKMGWQYRDVAYVTEQVNRLAEQAKAAA